MFSWWNLVGSVVIKLVIDSYSSSILLLFCILCIYQELEEEIMRALEKVNGIKDMISRNHMKVCIAV